MTNPTADERATWEIRGKMCLPHFKFPIFFAVAAIFCAFITLAACGKNESVGSNNTYQNQTSEKSLPVVRKIIFHDTVEDPQSDYLNSLGGGGSETSGTSSMDLVLYETKPNVFEGCGIMSRIINIDQGDAGGSVQKYLYRTGLICAESGKEGFVTLTGWLTYDNNIQTMMPEAPFKVISHKDATLRQESLPLLMTLNGNQASLSIKLHDHAELVFSGKITSEAVESPVGRPFDSENLIYVNSMWSCSFSGGHDADEYTAILLASPKAGVYSGQLSIQGTGDLLNAVNETVSFSLEPFDTAAYLKAGGQMGDKFASMSVLHADDGTYILLLDGDKVILEAAGKGVYFCGKTASASESGALQNEAAKTEKMLSYLYRQKSGTEASLPDFSGLKDLNPQKPEDMQKLMEASEKMAAIISHQDAPAWYPSDLIPLVNLYKDDGYTTIPSDDEKLFRIYNTQYYEMKDFIDLAEAYRSRLSCYDGYREYLNLDDSEGVFLFTMGQYSVQIFLSQSVAELTSVCVQIY